MSSFVQQNPSTFSVKTVASAQSSDASINLVQPKTEKVSNTIRPPISAVTRFFVTLACLITQGIALIFAEKFITSEKSFVKYFGTFLGFFTAFFTSEWIRIHSFALTRQKRAFFDEVNILETYQPRARTMGHLFQPDPPTPGPVVKIADDPNQPTRSASEQAAFNANRDAHYANMFEHAMRIAKESEEADRQAVEAQKARLAATVAVAAKSDSGSSTATVIPKVEPLYEEFSNTNAPPPPPLESIKGGTALELPSSFREKSDSTSPSNTNATSGTTKKTTDSSGVTDENGNTTTGTTTTGTETGTTTGTGTENTDAGKIGRKRRKKNKK